MAKEHVDHCLTIREEASVSDLWEGANNRIHQATGLLTALRANDNFTSLSTESLSGSLWAIQDLLGEAEAMQKKLWEAMKSK